MSPGRKRKACDITSFLIPEAQNLTLVWLDLDILIKPGKVSWTTWNSLELKLLNPVATK